MSFLLEAAGYLPPYADGAQGHSVLEKNKIFPQVEGGKGDAAIVGMSL